MTITELATIQPNENPDIHGVQSPADMVTAPAVQATPAEQVQTVNAIKDKSFFAGGRAVFTVSAPDTHYTFRIGRSRPEQPLFVSLLSGPDNENSFTYLGIYNPDTDSIRLTARSRFTADSRPVKAVQWAVKSVAKGWRVPNGCAIQHAGKCCVCGRRLTTPESIDAGIGPECLKRRA